MAEIVLAYCASHAPMMAAAREAAPQNQQDNFFGALESIRKEARERDVQACVVLSNEHFTNFFLENFPQICIGVGERNWGPTEAWLPIDKAWIPGRPDLANHIARHALDHGFDPAFSHLLELDHGIDKDGASALLVKLPGQLVIQIADSRDLVGDGSVLGIADRAE